MTINKFTGKTKEEAIECAKQAFGPNAVIMNIKEIKPKGLFGIFKSSTYEVTAAMDEKKQTQTITTSQLARTEQVWDMTSDRNNIVERAVHDIRYKLEID